MVGRIGSRAGAIARMLATVVGLWTLSLFAAEPVTYLDADGSEKVCSEFTLLQKRTNNPADGWWGPIWGEAGKTTWYVAEGAVTNFMARVVGDVRLILMDGASLYVKGNSSQGTAIQVAVDGQSSLTVYAQSTGDAMGSLTAVGYGNPDAAAGIGGHNITINGGWI